MSSSNVFPLPHKEVTPHVVVNELGQRLPIISAIFVVSIENGIPTIYATGDLNDLCLAAVVLQGYAQRKLYAAE